LGASVSLLKEKKKNTDSSVYFCREERGKNRRIAKEGPVDWLHDPPGRGGLGLGGWNSEEKSILGGEIKKKKGK